MIDSITRITLNLQETNTMVSIRAKRGDTGRKLLIHLSDGSISYHISDDCYATFTAKKPDGTKINNACTIENNVIEYEFTEQTCTAVGNMKAEIRLYGADDKMITSACFLVNVYDTVFRDGDEVGSETEMNTLDDLILRANAFLNETGNLLRWQGNWDSETEYEANDLVLHEEVLYVAEEAIAAGTAPGSEGVTAWVPIAGMGTGDGGNVDLTGYATEEWVEKGYQPKGNYLTKVPDGYAKTEDIPKKPEDIGALPSTYTPPNQTAEQVGADPKGTAANAVSRHNTDTNAHNDLRLELKRVADRLAEFLDSDDEKLDQLSELIAGISSNKTLIEAVTTGKVSVTDIIDNLTTNVANKPLSAAQGVALKGLIDNVSKSLSNYQPKGDYALRSEIPAVPVQSVNGKTGAVRLSAADVGARPSDWVPTAADVGALPSTYTPPNQTAEQVGADPKGTAANAVSRHNTDTNAHNDLRLELKRVAERLSAFLDSDDVTLDQLSELIAVINSNKTLIEAVTTGKVNVKDIINDLVTNVANKPLSAAQGVVLKGLIEQVRGLVPTDEHINELINEKLLSGGSDSESAKNILPDLSPLNGLTKTENGLYYGVYATTNDPGYQTDENCTITGLIPCTSNNKPTLYIKGVYWDASSTHSRVLLVNSSGGPSATYNAPTFAASDKVSTCTLTELDTNYYKLVVKDRAFVNIYGNPIDVASIVLSFDNTTGTEEIIVSLSPISDTELPSQNDTVPDGVLDAASGVVDKAMSREGNRLLRFLISSDAHHSNDNNLVIKGTIELGQAQSEILTLIGVDFVANLGDIAWGTSTNTVAEVVEQIKTYKRLTASGIKGECQLWCEGNHDDGNYSLTNYPDTPKLTEAAINTLLYSKNRGVIYDDAHMVDGYCYKDFDHIKTRVICLNTEQGEGDGGVVNGYQLKWFAETALDMSNKNDWSVLTLAHHPLGYPMGTLFKDCINIIDAFIKGSNFRYTTVDGTAIAADYSNKNSQYVGHFHGHAHAFSVVKMQKYVDGEYIDIDAWEICIPNACFTRNNQYLGNTNERLARYSTEATYAKTDDDGNRTSFNLVTVCLDERKIYADNFGAGIDREVSFDFAEQ